MPKAPDVISVAEAAGIIGIDPSQVRRHIRAKRLPATAVGERGYALSRSAVEKFAKIDRQPGRKKSAEK